MKKIVLVMMLLVTSVFANGINWAKDFQSGVDQAKKENKPILFVYSNHACKYCVLLEKTTFADKEVIEKLNTEYVSIIAYGDEGDKFPQELWRPGTPTSWFLKSNGEPMFQPLMGAVNKEYFLKALEIVTTEFNKQQKK